MIPAIAPIEPFVEGISTLEMVSKNKTVGQTFLDKINYLDDVVKVSNNAISTYVLGDGDISTHELMITLQHTKQELELAVEVRNKLVEAYESVTRMRI